MLIDAVLWRKWLLAALALLASVSVAAAQVTNPLFYPAGAPNSVSALAYMPVGTVCTSETDVSVGVSAAIAAGNLRIFLPSNCVYYPPHSGGGNVVPAGVTIIGQDWWQSGVSVTDRAVDSMSLGAGASVQNVWIRSLFCDQTPSPASTQKVCPVGFAINIGDASAVLTNWVAQTSFLYTSGQTTSPTGVVSTDTPLLAVIQAARGSDGFYAATTGLGGAESGATSAIRVVTGASGRDNGIYLLNGFYNSASIGHAGMFIKDFSNNNSSILPSLYIDRVGNGGNVSHSLTISDVDSVGSTNTTPFITLTAANQASGQLVNIFQTATPYSGDAIIENMGNNSGTFSGNFLRFQIAGVDKAKINNAGNLTLAGTLSVTGAGAISGTLTAGNAQTEYLTFSGAAANPIIAAAGGATDANININPAGTGIVLVNSGLTATGFSAMKGGAFIGNASANYVNIVGAASGGFSLVNAVGSDSDISLKAVGKGNNGTLTGYFSSTSDPTGLQIVSGTCSDWWNTTAVTFKHWCNFGGSLKSVAMN